jgi:hypothetical protein
MQQTSKGFSLLCLAACYTVLRSRWYQSGVRIWITLSPVRSTDPPSKSLTSLRRRWWNSSARSEFPTAVQKYNPVLCL